ncbi:MAG: zinc-dependent peptidase [Bacteroidia bacterium]
MPKQTESIPYDSLPDTLRALIDHLIQRPSQQPEDEFSTAFLAGALIAIFVIAGIIIFMYSVHLVEGQIAFHAKLKERERQVLKEYFRYYHTLSMESRILFEKRLAMFMSLKKFRSKQGFANPLEARVLVSAVAIQLSMGLPKFTLPHFRNIFIFPEAYYSHITERYHKGEVNLNGRIVISWKDFILGMKHPEDGLHVGIHEFAHAFYFENYIDNDDYLFIDDVAFKRYFALATGEIDKIKKKLPSFIREYAATNEQEFFAVTTEHFFEQPADMKMKLPELYDALAQVWNQDPAAY